MSGFLYYRHTQPRTYHIWQSIIDRCTNPKHNRYHEYGGRGITVPDSWLGKEGMHAMLADIGDPPDDKSLVLLRDRDAPYSKENCFWGTRASVQRCRRSTPAERESTKPFAHHMVTAFGETLPLCEWAKKTGMQQQTLFMRLTEYGMSPEEAFTRPFPRRMITAFGETMSLSEWSRKTGIVICTLAKRLKDGMSPEEALSKSVKPHKPHPSRRQF